MWLSTIALAQETESDSVIYDRSFKPSRMEKKKNTYAAKEGRIRVVQNRKAKLTYSTTYLFLNSSQGVDTVFLADIKKIKRKLSGGKCLSLCYSTNSHNTNYLDITFPTESQAKKEKSLIESARFTWFYNHQNDDPMWVIILDTLFCFL